MNDLFNSASISDTDDFMISDAGEVLGASVDGIEDPINPHEEPKETQGGNDDLDQIIVELKEAKETDEPGDNNQTLDKKENSSSSTAKSGSSSVFVPFASALQEKGILSEEDVKLITESDEPSDALFESISKGIDGEINGWIDSLPENLKYVLSNYKEGVPLSELISAQSEYEDVASITDKQLENSEAHQETVFREYYKAKGFSDKRIDSSIERSKGLGMLLEDSLEFKKELVESKDSARQSLAEKEKARKAEVAKDNAEKIEKIKTAIDATEEIIPGVKINDKTRDEIYKNMTQPFAKDARGNPQSFVMAKRAENPVEFEKRLNYMTMLGFFDEKADFKTLIGSSKSKAVSQFEDSLKRSSDSIANNTISSSGFGADEIEESAEDWSKALSGF